MCARDGRPTKGHCPSRGLAWVIFPCRVSLDSARQAHRTSPKEVLRVLRVSVVAEPDKSWGGGGGQLESKNADAEDNELSKAEATHLVLATLY